MSLIIKSVGAFLSHHLISCWSRDQGAKQRKGSYGAEPHHYENLSVLVELFFRSIIYRDMPL